jgi:hypothetical protein
MRLKGLLLGTWEAKKKSKLETILSLILIVISRKEWEFLLITPPKQLSKNFESFFRLSTVWHQIVEIEEQEVFFGFL